MLLSVGLRVGVFCRMAASKLRVPWNANSLTVFNLADLIANSPFHCSDLISTVLEVSLQ